MVDAEKMHSNFESWREQAMRKVKQYRKNKRFKVARAYWEGYAQACANAKCIAYGYTMAARDMADHCRCDSVKVGERNGCPAHPEDAE